ncbi:hypothetical protein [Shewanella psychropiezotolerans]|uniref:hypothetical protein n=1 Tax=Shewanella psychropiezotolerans TaxID=2593655 RepID=UPI001E4C8729|nr:hypothetical protein [Shewanella psychropiezotolerans]
MDDSEVKIVDVEPAGKGLDISEHSAILTLGSLGALYGFKCYLLQDEAGESLLVYSIAPSLD